MTISTSEALARGKRVGLAIQTFGTEIADLPPLEAAIQAVAGLVTVIETKHATQDVDTTPSTTVKEQCRETMARSAAALSHRMVAYALVQGDRGLQQRYTLSYTDVRYGEASEDVNAVRELVQQAQTLPSQVRTDYKITSALIQAAEDAVQAFEAAGDVQTTTKADGRLATLSVPELEKQLRRQLEIVRRLTEGMRQEGGRWQELSDAVRDANKTRDEPAQRRLATAAKVVKKLGFVRSDGAAFRLDKQNYGPAYELEVKNLSAGDLLLWMGLEKDPTGDAPATALRCLAGQTTKVRRNALGPELARYLMGQFVAADGGEVKVKVRRVVE